MIVGLPMGASALIVSLVMGLWIPAMAQIIEPDSAAQTAIIANGINQFGAVATPLLVRLADKRLEFSCPMSAATWLSLASTYLLALVIEYRTALGGLAIYAMHICVFVIGFATNAGLNMAFALTAAYSLPFPEKAASYASVYALMPLVYATVAGSLGAAMPVREDTVNATGVLEIVAAAEPPTKVHLEGVYVILFIGIVIEFVRLVFLPKRYLSPHNYYMTPEQRAAAEEMAAYLKAQSTSEDSVRDWLSRAYRPMLLFTCSVTALLLEIIGIISVIVYFFEDHTTLGEDAASFYSGTLAIGSLISMCIIFPVGNWLERINRPLFVYVIFSATTALMPLPVLLSPYGIIFAVPSTFLFSIYITIFGLTLLPALLTTVTAPEHISRDTSIMFAIAAIGPGIMALFTSPFLARFGEEAVPGRRRPRYAMAGYVAFTFLLVGIGIAGALTAYAAKRMVERRANARLTLT